MVKALFRYYWGRASLLIHVHWLPPPKVVFERSALDVRNIKLLYLWGRVFPDWGTGRQTSGVLEAGHKHNMFIRTTSRDKDTISRK